MLFHDYHLYLAPGLVRQARPDVVSSHFVHIPWPEPDAWSPLPPELTAAIHAGPARERRRRLPHGAVAARVSRVRRPLRARRRRLDPRRRRIRSASTQRSSSGAPTIRSCSSGRRRSRRGDPSSSSCASTASIRRRTSCAASRRSALLLERHPELHGERRLPRAARAVARGHPGVRGVRGGDRGGGRRRERALRARRLDAGRARHRRRLPALARRLQGVRRPARERGLRRAQPRGEGGVPPQHARRRARPLGERRRARGDRPSGR